MSRHSIFLLLFFCVFVGCGPAPTFSAPDSGLGAAAVDAGPSMVSMVSDAGPTMDASALTDASETMDAATIAMDSGVTERCACPSLPTICTPAAAEVPTFTPESPALIEQLLDVVACADRSLDIAIYEADYACLTDALLARLEAAPELQIQMSFDDASCRRGSAGLDCDIQRLADHPRVRLQDDMASRLMHHKYVVADDARVWVSSGNFTRNSFCTDHNNALIVDEPAIVAAYAQNFARLMRDPTFRPLPREAVVEAGSYRVFFSPETPTTDARWQTELLAQIAAASTSIEVMISAWTLDEIAVALVAAQERGVSVRVLVSNRYDDDSPAQMILAAGIPIRTSTIHSKAMVIDGQVVATGSGNWSVNARSNHENSLWIDDSIVASLFQREFERIFTSAEPVMVPSGS